jgi:hypothetical protein
MNARWQSMGFASSTITSRRPNLMPPQPHAAGPEKRHRYSALVTRRLEIFASDKEVEQVPAGVENSSSNRKEADNGMVSRQFVGGRTARG